MKIAIFTDTIFPDQVNGVAKVAERSAAMLRDIGHEVEVISVRDVPTLPFWGYKGERFALPFGVGYRRAQRMKPDIIHVHTPFTLGWEGVFAAKKLGVPLVGTHHTFFDHYLEHLHLDSTLTRRLSWQYLVGHYNRYNLVLSPSQALLDGMQTNGLTARAQFFPNAVHTEQFSPADADRKLELKNRFGIKGECLVYMGRVSYEKSIDKVIEAFALVTERHADSTLLIVGDGPEMKKLAALAESLGVRDRVVFAGMLHGSDLVEALQAGDVFITASKSENMPLSIIEAMATGLPVVGVDALGVPEIVRDGIEGFVVEPDNVETMSERVLTLFEDQALREHYAAAARLRALEFTETENARALEAVYMSLLQP